MAVFGLIPGAGGAAWYWHRVVPEFHARGHGAIAVDLPGDDNSAGLLEYTDAILSAIKGNDDVVLVAQSLGAFSAAMVCARASVGLLVLLNAMIPLPHETPGQWWVNTGSEEARVAAAEARGYKSEFDIATYFLHDVPADVADAGAKHARPEADVVFGQACDIEQWPAVTTRVIAARADRFFPLEFQRRVARDRLGIDVDEVPGGHLAALSHPTEVAERLISYLV